MNIETLEKPKIESEKDIPQNLEFGTIYKIPDNFLKIEKYKKEIDKIDQQTKELINLKEDASNKQSIRVLTTKNIDAIKEISKTIANDYFIDNFEKNENGYLNAIVPTKSCVPFIIKRVIDEVLLENLGIEKNKISDVLTVFSEIYDNFKGKATKSNEIFDKSTFDTFELKILIKKNQDANTIQILAGDPNLEKNFEVDSKFELDDINLDDSENNIIENLSENGRGLKIINMLSDKFEIRTNEDKTSYSYLAEIKL